MAVKQFHVFFVPPGSPILVRVTVNTIEKGYSREETVNVNTTEKGYSREETIMGHTAGQGYSREEAGTTFSRLLRVGTSVLNSDHLEADHLPTFPNNFYPHLNLCLNLILKLKETKIFKFEQKEVQVGTY